MSQESAGGAPATAFNRAAADTAQHGIHISPANHRAEAHHGKGGFMGLTLGSIGVVFGDIGTSPLYALKSALLRGGNTVASSEEVRMASLRASETRRA